MRSVNLVSQNYLKISGKFFRNYSIKSTDLTANRYAIKKGHFNSPTDEDVRKFQSILEKNILLEESDVRSYNIDHFKNLKGQSKIVLKPKTTEQVSKILKHCNERRIAVCPQGGNTGVVGGSVSIFDEVIISMELMNKIEKIEEFSGVLVCQSGCILEKLNEEVRKKGMCMPLDLGSKGSCQIGGNLSTNAGGLRLLRYGSLHGSVLGLEAVTADGKILNLLSNFKKDNTGYHLKHLFIGSEGTLGVITRASINCPPASRAINLALLGIENFEKVLKIFLTAKKDLGEILSGCEMMDSGSLQCGVDRYDIV
jgi:D-2-hydroxyglutarate dehydrogenase